LASDGGSRRPYGAGIRRHRPKVASAPTKCSTLRTVSGEKAGASSSPYETCRASRTSEPSTVIDSFEINIDY
jgi:hypothetical protein